MVRRFGPLVVFMVKIVRPVNKAGLGGGDGGGCSVRHAFRISLNSTNPHHSLQYVHYYDSIIVHTHFASTGMQYVVQYLVHY